ncbi:MAG: UDP-3-O-(3-hydroxymyristoyl)glucosamine N-acyltransferase [Chitinophagaceae bacterium]|nr:UDP-3-O-(3-hydroxymyristoyl)glucosamine N-acyltransferase [Chitinophagaceae bacterium]
MKFPSPVSVQWIASLINADAIGNINASVTGINEIHRVEPGDIVFVDHPKYYDQCIQSPASCIIINNKTNFPEEKSLLITENPFEAYLTIVRHFRPYQPLTKAISDSAVWGKHTILNPGVVIGHEVVIGDNCFIGPNVTIMDHCRIGNNVVIQSGTVIGSDAFYYNKKKNREVWYKRMVSCGRVVIENDVEIGAGCTIDRGVTHDTIIGQGTKIDNMVHIGHDTIIGKNCLLAAQVAIAGGVEIGNGVTLWGQVGINKTLVIEDNVTVLAQSGVPGSLKRDQIYFGTPAIEATIKKRELIWIKRIPELWKKVMENKDQ